MLSPRERDEKIEELERESRALRKELGDNQDIATQMTKRRQTIEQRLVIINNQLKQLRPKALQKPNITDHAILRYAERHYGLQLDTLRQEIAAAIGDVDPSLGEVRFKGFVLKGSSVITYVPTGADAFKDEPTAT